MGFYGLDGTRAKKEELQLLQRTCFWKDHRINII